MPSPQGSKAKTADEKSRKEEKFGKFKQKVKARVIVLKPFEGKYQARIVGVV
jgi:hypothetical protein